MSEDLERSIGRLEGQVSAMTSQMGHFNAHLDDFATQLNDQKALLKSVIAEKKGEMRVLSLISALFGGGLVAAINWWATR